MSFKIVPVTCHFMNEGGSPSVTFKWIEPKGKPAYWHTYPRKPEMHETEEKARISLAVLGSNLGITGRIGYGLVDERDPHQVTQVFPSAALAHAVLDGRTPALRKFSW